MARDIRNLRPSPRSMTCNCPGDGLGWIGPGSPLPNKLFSTQDPSIVVAVMFADVTWPFTPVTLTKTDTAIPRIAIFINQLLDPASPPARSNCFIFEVWTVRHCNDKRKINFKIDT